MRIGRRRVVRAWVWPLLALVMLAAAFPVAAVQDDETELRSEADYVYGQSLEFRLLARNLGPVQGVTLFFRPHASIDSFAVEIPVDSAGQVDASYTLDLTQNRLPPFSTVSYWWELQRPDGDSFRVPEQTISYVDDQFSWQWSTRTDPTSGGSVSAYWTGPSADLGDRALDMVGLMLPEIGSLLPLQEVQPFNLFIYPSSADLASAMRLAGLDWQPGQSYPELGVALLTVVNEGTAQQELADGLSRELTSLLMHQALGDSADRVPRWIRAGLQLGALPVPESELEAAIAAAEADGRTIPFATLCETFPDEGDEVPIAQAQSESMLRFIGTEFGPERAGLLITAFANGESCEAAVRTTLQLSPEELEQMWVRRDVEETTISGPWLAAVVGLLIIAGLGVAALLVWRPRRSAG